LKFKGMVTCTPDGTRNLSGLYIPIAICEFNLQKLIVKTEITGTKIRGSVKELINIGEYDMTIKGCFISTDNKYPAAEVQALDGYMKANKPIQVVHQLCTLLEIDRIVIEKGGLIAKPGFQNVQFFEINCCEDTPLELQLKTQTNT